MNIMKYAIKIENYDDEEIIMDIMGVMFGGLDTTSATITSLLYFLKKHPVVLSKLMNEIKQHKLDHAEDIPIEELKEAYQNINYLTYVVKEGMRIDTPAPISLTYKAFEETELCGVVIPEGQDVNICVSYVHFDPQQWQRPTEFLPERFDPESELFYKPGTKNVRHPKAFNSFSNGKRKCVGQVLAMQSARVILVQLLTKMNYDVDKELLEREKPSFNIFSETDLLIKIK